MVDCVVGRSSRLSGCMKYGVAARNKGLGRSHVRKGHTAETGNVERAQLPASRRLRREMDVSVVQTGTAEHTKKA